MNNKTKLIVLNGIMIALVCITTMVIQIPIPMTEGYVVGIIVRKNTNLVKNILATLLGVLIMVSGYLLAGTFLQGSFIISLGSVPSNTIQGIVSMVIGIPIASYLLTVKYVKSFKQIPSTEADKLLSSQKLTVVYIGRETCPYCRKFAKKLGNLYNKLNTVIYYVNSEDFSDNEISSFREKYHVVTVPGFIVSKNGKYEIRCDSSMSEDEIINMLK